MEISDGQILRLGENPIASNIAEKVDSAEFGIDSSEEFSDGVGAGDVGVFYNSPPAMSAHIDGGGFSAVEVSVDQDEVGV